MKWQRENEFKDMLDKAAKNGSKAAITTAQAIAVQDMAQCYKHVCALVDRQMRKSKPRQRLNAFFLISAICRHSLKKHKLQDKYIGRWTPVIAELTGLLQGISAEQLTQVEKVLASWRKEKVFSEATIALCAASLDLSNLGADAAVPSALPQPSEPMQDGAIVAANAAPPSPANSLFSEPSAGSIDAAVLDAFPPKTVASANVEPLPRPADAAVPPASHASTGSSRPPEPPSNPAPPEQYDPFNEAESYDYNPFGQNSPLRDSAHTLPPVPTAAVPQPNGSSAQQPQTDAAPAAEPATRKKRRTFDQPNLPLPPPPNATAANPSAANSIALDVNAVVPTPTAQPSRKRRSRWEDAPSVAQTKDDPTAIPDPPQIVSVSAATLPVSQAEASTLHANSLPVASQQIELQPSGIVLDTLVQPPLPPSQPPKATSAKQNGEAQAAAALIAVEQMLQAKRHAEGRVQPAAGIHRPAHPPPPPAPVQQQPPPPQSQPPLPPLPPPLAPQPALPQAHPSYPFGAPAVPFQTGQLLAGGPSRSPLGAAHMHGHQAWPHMSMPHMGHMQPHQHVHAGLQQHHVPAPMHHSPSMLQQQRWPQQQGVSQGTVPPHPPPPPQAPPPPQWGSPMQGNVHLHSQQTGNGPARATTAAAASGPPVRATAPQAPKWAPDAHFQDFPRTDDYATPMPTDVDSAFKTRRTSGPSAATAPVGSNPASDAPPAPPSPPPGPPSPPPAPPAAHSLPANSAPAQPNGPAASSAPSDEPAPPSNDNVVPQSEQSNGAAPSEGPADETIGTGSMVGGAAESRSTSPLLSSIAPEGIAVSAPVEAKLSNSPGADLVGTDVGAAQTEKMSMSE